MARSNQTLIKAITRAAKKIRNSRHYQWGHMGACNCGHLAQELTQLSKGEIHQFAMEGYGDWSEQVAAFCPTSGMSMDLLISELIVSGLSLEDLINLERLSDKKVLATIPGGRRNKLKHNSAKDVGLYMEYWAKLLKNQLREKEQASTFSSVTS